MALGITAFLHLPLLFIALEMPAFRELPPLASIDVAFSLQQALETTLLQAPSWHIKGFNLPPLINPEEPPHYLFSSRVLLDAEEGKIIWNEPHPLFSPYLSKLTFAKDDGHRYRWGYIAISP